MSSISIENGYFVFTLMPSLFCKLRCPHCYLSLEQRKDKTILSIEDIRIACQKVDDYYKERKLKQKTIICYWYGGEPTSMGIPYFKEMADTINSVFTKEKGYRVKHTILSALVGVKEDWYPVFEEYGNNYVQTSFDGLMRGDKYVQRWEESVKKIIDRKIDLATISVVNSTLLKDEPEPVLDYLSELGVKETSWLPFMLNEQNYNSGKYEEYAPKMNDWSNFMIRLTEHWLKRKSENKHVPEIGQMSFILSQRNLPSLSNIASQTLFLMPNGDFVLPDYKYGWYEFMQPFGNIFEKSFKEILFSPERRKYIRRQVTRNKNPECRTCEHSNKCVMEFWKDNRPGDDCFGGKKYIEWLLVNKKNISKYTYIDHDLSLY